jgi:CHAT domain-containing protein
VVRVQKSVAWFLTALLWAAPLAGQEDDWALITQEVKKLFMQGRTTEALPLAEQALRIAESSFGPLDRRLAASLTNLGDLYRDHREMAKAEGFFKRSLAIAESSSGVGSLSEAAPLNDLAMLYKDEGRLQDAEPLFKQALTIYKNGLGQAHPFTVIALNNLGDLYRAEGRNAQAESFYRGAAFLAEKSLELELSPEILAVAHSLRSMIRHNLGELYRSQGRYAEAEEWYKAALEIREKELGEDHPDTASSLNAMAILYVSEGKYADAERLCRRSLEIRRRVLGEDHRTVAYSLSTLAAILRAQQKRDEAGQDYKKAIEIEERTLGKENPLLTAPLEGLAEIYQDQAKYDEAEMLYRRVLAIRRNEKRADDADVGSSYLNLAELDYARGNYTASEALFEEAFTHLHQEFDYQFSYLGETDRLAFLDVVGNAFPLYFSFCYTNRNENPALVGRLYDIVLWRKGVVAGSIAGVRARAAASGNKEAQAQLEQLTALRTRIAEMQNPPAEHIQAWNQTLLQLQDEAHSLERSLVERVVQAKGPAPPSWHDVQKALKPAEAAVEFVRFRFHDRAAWTSKFYYAALVVTGRSAGVAGAGNAPILVPLGEAQELEGAPMDDYRQRVAKGPPPAPDTGAAFYRAFWKPLEPALKDRARVYVSPDGVLNQVSWAAVPADDGRLLIEKHAIDVVLSTKDLLRQERASTSARAVLIGNPAFDLAEPEQRAALDAWRGAGRTQTLVAGLRKPAQSADPPAENSSDSAAGSVPRVQRSRDAQDQALPALPGTQKEIESAQGLLKQRGWQVETYSQQNALEEVIKAVKSPRLLHVATHGFFEPDQASPPAERRSDEPPGQEDPMLRSGLYFAGANRTLAGRAASGLEDGVMTAFEATGLDLQGTELVVLSACETGLGHIQNGEGIFGLQRAMQEAGARALLMSLWSVPDDETQELMTLFYSEWLAGKDKHEALHDAQLKLRKEIIERWGDDQPYYWAAFVLVGR